jgi:hypothetical protein
MSDEEQRIMEFRGPDRFYLGKASLARDCTSAHPDIYSLAIIKTNNALVDVFRRNAFLSSFIVMRYGSDLNTL